MYNFPDFSDAQNSPLIMRCIVGHGIPQSDVDKTFEYSKLFFDLPVSVKEKHPFDLDTFAGWRGLQELSEVTGSHRTPLPGDCPAVRCLPALYYAAARSSAQLYFALGLTLQKLPRSEVRQQFREP